jgi:hypothetical protein
MASQIAVDLESIMLAGYTETPLEVPINWVDRHRADIERYEREELSGPNPYTLIQPPRSSLQLATAYMLEYVNRYRRETGRQLFTNLNPRIDAERRMETRTLELRFGISIREEDMAGRDHSQMIANTFGDSDNGLTMPEKMRLLATLMESPDEIASSGFFRGGRVTGRTVNNHGAQQLPRGNGGGAGVGFSYEMRPRASELYIAAIGGGAGGGSGGGGSGVGAVIDDRMSYVSMEGVSYGGADYERVMTMPRTPPVPEPVKENSRLPRGDGRRKLDL